MFCSFTVCSVLSLGVPPCNCLFVWLGLWPYTDAWFLICALYVLSPVRLYTSFCLFGSASSSLRHSICLSASPISFCLFLCPLVSLSLFISFSLFAFSVSLSFYLFLSISFYLPLCLS